MRFQKYKDFGEDLTPVESAEESALHYLDIDSEFLYDSFKSVIETYFKKMKSNLTLSVSAVFLNEQHTLVTKKEMLDDRRLIPHAAYTGNTSIYNYTILDELMDDFITYDIFKHTGTTLEQFLAMNPVMSSRIIRFSKIKLNRLSKSVDNVTDEIEGKIDELRENL